MFGNQLELRAFSSGAYGTDGLKVTINEVADVKVVRKPEELGKGRKVPVKALKRNQIDESLRRVYDDMLEDGVPERFEKLLRALREQDDK